MRGLQLVEVIDPTELVAEVAAPPRLDPPLEPWDIATVNYTSGTTGPSKGVLTTYMQLVQTSLDSRWDMRPGDCMLVMSPLFHIGGQMPAVAGLVAGERIALRGQFSGSTFLDVVREVGVTQAFLVGTMGAFIDALPAQPADVENPLRELMIAPMVPDPDAFRARFGVDTLICAFGMSECGIGTIAWNPPSEKRNTAGRAREGAEIRVVDEHDIPVPAGQVGELIIRTERPWELTVGYLNRPDETARAWRNGWFHTGDAFHVDEDGWFYFADRIKDSLRRRGDNISSFEVERSVSMFDGVAEAACVAAPGQYGDDEVKVFVVLEERREFDPVALVEWLTPRMPYFMVPRYIEVVDVLPKTPSLRVKKFELREQGNSDATWDREAAGIVLKRDY